MFVLVYFSNFVLQVFKSHMLCLIHLRISRFMVSVYCTTSSLCSIQEKLWFYCYLNLNDDFESLHILKLKLEQIPLDSCYLYVSDWSPILRVLVSRTEFIVLPANCLLTHPQSIGVLVLVSPTPFLI